MAEAADGDFALIRKCGAKENGKNIGKRQSGKCLYKRQKIYGGVTVCKTKLCGRTLRSAANVRLFLGLCDDIAVVSNAAPKMQYGYMISRRTVGNTVNR